MTLEGFARDSGIEIVPCDPQWGGPFAYRFASNPNTLFCGYKTKHAALKAWALDVFGDGPGGALVRLLTPNAEVSGGP